MNQNQVALFFLEKWKPLSRAVSERVRSVVFPLHLNRCFALKEKGQATVEYILILTISVVAAASIGRQVVRALDTTILRLGGQLEKDLKAGRAPVETVWGD